MNQQLPTTTETDTQTPDKENVLSYEELERLVDSLNLETLGVFAGTGERCSVVLDRDCPPNVEGYTIPNDGGQLTIYLNPSFLAKNPRFVTEAICLHEVGHNAKPAVNFLNAQVKALKRPDIVPEAYRKSAK